LTEREIFFDEALASHPKLSDIHRPPRVRVRVGVSDRIRVSERERFFDEALTNHPKHSDIHRPHRVRVRLVFRVELGLVYC
jgi:hypothetical protein